MLLSWIIKSKENIDVATCDIPGASMQADMDKMIWVWLTGHIAKIMEQVEPNKYGKYIVYQKGIPVLYLILKNALYGNLQVNYYSVKISPRN